MASGGFARLVNRTARPPEAILAISYRAGAGLEVDGAPGNLSGARSDRSGVVADATGGSFHPVDMLCEACDTLSDTVDRRFYPADRHLDTNDARFYRVVRFPEVCDRLPVPADCIAEPVARRILRVDRVADRDDGLPERVAYF